MIVTPAYCQAFPSIFASTQSLSTQQGTISAGSPVITGLTSTALFTVGMAVYGPYIPAGSLILSVDSDTAITMTQPVSSGAPGGTYLLTFPTNALLSQLIAAAQSAMESYVDFPFEVVAATEFYSGNNYPDLILRRPYVSSVSSVVLDATTGGAWGQYGLTYQTGNLTMGSPIISGLASTSGLIVGQQLYDSSDWPQSVKLPMPCFIVSINSGTQITVSGPATVNASAEPLTFMGGYGQTQQLAQGQGWTLVREGDWQGIAKAGLLRYCPQGWGYAGFGWTGGWNQGGGYGRTTLTPVSNRNPGWPMGQGNVEVTYTAGWTGLDGGPLGTATPNIPQDLCQACVETVQFLAQITPQGGQTTTNESLGKYSYGLGLVNMADVSKNAVAAAGPLGTVRQVLSRYRDLSI